MDSGSASSLSWSTSTLTPPLPPLFMLYFLQVDQMHESGGEWGLHFQVSLSIFEGQVSVYHELGMLVYNGPLFIGIGSHFALEGLSKCQLLSWKDLLRLLELELPMLELVEIRWLLIPHTCLLFALNVMSGSTFNLLIWEICIGRRGKWLFELHFIY